MPWLEYKGGLNQEILSFCQIFGSTDPLWESWCDIGLREGSGSRWSKSGPSQSPCLACHTFRHTLIRDIFTSGNTFQPSARVCLVKLPVGGGRSLPAICLQPRARPGCCGAKTAWDRDLVSLAPTVGPSRAALGPTAWQRNTPLAGVLLALELLLPARHAACGGRGNRKRVR